MKMKYAVLLKIQPWLMIMSQTVCSYTERAMIQLNQMKQQVGMRPSELGQIVEMGREEIVTIALGQSLAKA